MSHRFDSKKFDRMRDDEEEDDFEGLERRQLLASRAYQQGTVYIAIDVLLREIRLEKYIEKFERASEDMFELHATRTDEEVDAIIQTVEHANDFEFPNSDRCKIWKSLRYLWFLSPGAAKGYIDPAEVPRLVLPKHDFRARDQDVDMNTLEPERQQMIKRTSVYDQVNGASIVQEEVYVRESHLGCVLKGLDKTIKFWMSQDPRKMAREDPREESLISQLKSLELEISYEIDKLRVVNKSKTTILYVFLVIKVCFLAGSALFLAVGIIDAPSTQVPSLTRFLSTSYLRLSLILFTSFWVIVQTTRKNGISQRLFNTYRAMHAKCRMLHSDMVSFRLKTHFIRLTQLLRYLDDADVALTGEAADAAAALTASNIRDKKKTSNGAYDSYMNTILRMSAADMAKLGSKLSFLSKSKSSHANNSGTLDLADRIALPQLPILQEPQGDRSVSERSLPIQRAETTESVSYQSAQPEDAASRLSFILNAISNASPDTRDYATAQGSAEDHTGSLRDIEADSDEDMENNASGGILNSYADLRTN